MGTSLRKAASGGQHAAWNQLRRSLQVRDGIALIVCNVVGVGIFTTPSMIAHLVPQPTAMLALWLVGAGLALAGAASYAELARRWPSAGGEYVYLSKSYGPGAGFLSGWTSLIAGFSGTVAASAVAFVLYIGQYFPQLASEQPLFAMHLWVAGINISPRSLCSALLIVAFAALHIRSLGAAKLTQNSLAVLIVGMVVLFVVLGFASGHGSWSNFQSSGVPLRPMNWLLALIPVMFTFSGWNAAAYLSEEMRDTRRIIGPVLLTGTCIVGALYLALNVLYVYAIPAHRMQSATNVGDVVAQALFGVGRDFVTPALLLTLLGAISANTVAGPRVYFAMARDGAFLPSFGRVSARFGTPHFAILLQSLWSIVLVFFGGFEQILMYTGFAIILSSGAAVAGLFVAQRRIGFKTASRTGMVVSALFVLASLAMVLDAIFEDPKTAAIGVLLIAAGLPVFVWSRKRKPKQLGAEPDAAYAE
jgi:basic amino acid/polyamine antiporter, APA family